MEELRGVAAPGRTAVSVWGKPCAIALAVAMALSLSACGGGGGGGGGGNVRPTPPPATGGSGGTGTGGTGGTGGATEPTGRFDVAANTSIVVPDILSGAIGVTKTGAGTLTLTGANAYAGPTQVNAGFLYIDGNQSAATGATTVAPLATLGGKGVVGGNLTVADGATLAPGSQGALGTLTINGNLLLSSASRLAMSAGPTGSDLIDVKGNLTLDGILDLDIASGTNAGPGVHRLLSYGGTLSDNGLLLDGAATSGWSIQTGVAHQVNLIDTRGMAFSFWDGDAGPANDGIIHGGNGTWQNAGAMSKTNWTDARGATNTAFGDGSFAVFQGIPGTVTVDAAHGDINVAGMQFASDGYVVQGDAIHLAGSVREPAQSTIRVGDGSAQGASYTATVNSVLTGSTGLVKTDAGTLVLGGDNTYTGGTTIVGGTLQVGNGGTTGTIMGDVVDNGTLTFSRSDTFGFAGDVSGSGVLKKAGRGTLVLTGNNTHTGGTIVSDGVLQIGDGGTAGWVAGDIVNNSYLRFNRSDDVVFGGNISGVGTLLKDGAGKVTLTGNATDDRPSPSAPSIAINSGTLQVGNGGTTGSISSGSVLNNGSLVFNRSDTYTYAGVVSGNGSLIHAGTGTLIFTNRIYSPIGIVIAKGTLLMKDAGIVADTGGSVLNNGTLILDYSAPGGWYASAPITGSGNLIKRGPGLAILEANNTYTGGTLVSEGTLRIGSSWSTGWVEGDIVNQGTVEFARQDNVTFSREVTGAGIVRQSGSGTLIISGDLRHTGGTVIDRGTLQVGTGGAAGSLAGNVIVNGTLAFDRSDDIRFDGIISGDYGTLRKAGAGTLTLGGLNTFGRYNIFGRGTTVEDGTLRIANGASVDNIVSVGGSAFLTVDHGGKATGAVLDDGATVDNAGFMGSSLQGPVVSGNTVTLINHDGGIIDGPVPDGITTPAVSLRTGSTLTNGVGSMIRGYTGVESWGVVNNAGGTIVGVVRDGIGGKATLINNTMGGQIVAGTSPPPFGPDGAGVFTTGFGVTINNLGSSAIVGTREGVRAYDGATVTNDGGSLISGATGINLAGAQGYTNFIANTGGSTITGTRAGIYLNDGGVIVNGSGSTIETTAMSSGDCAVTLSCAIFVPVYTGVGSVGLLGRLSLFNAGYIGGDVQMDAGVANNVTLFAGGTIQGALKIGGNAQSVLRLDGGIGTAAAYSTAVSGATTFAGTVVKTGAGLWVVDNDQLQNVVETSIDAGSLRATRALAGNVAVNPEGTLDGVPGVNGNLVNAGIVAVRGGPTTVAGTYAQASTGTLAVSLGSTLDVGGAATLSGGTLRVTGADAGYVANAHTDVLTAAGGVSGTFGQLVKDTGVIFTSSTINYTPNSVWLDTRGLDVTTAAAGQGVTYTPLTMRSAQRVQIAFDQLNRQFATNDASVAASGSPAASADFIRAAGEFQQAPTLEAAQASLQSLSGQLHAASAAMTFEAIDASNRVLSDHFDGLLGNSAGYGMWTQSLNVGGDMGRSGYGGVGFQLNGWLVGSDRQIGGNGVAGFAFGQSQGRQQLDRSADRNRSRSTDGMFYAGWLNGPWYTQGRVGFGRFTQDVDRQLLLGRSAEGVATRYSGNYNVAYGETGLRLDLGGSRVTPFFSAEYASIDRNGFAERGAGGFGLRSKAQTVDRWQAGLGLRATHRWNLDGGRAVALNASAQFQRTLASHGDVFDASFVGMQQWQPLTGIGLSRYRAVLNVGVDATLSERTSMTFGYDYQKGQRDQAQSVSARVVMAF
ncbi:autotransporter-associated beta strand repeat-containing protein [Luteibacter sp. UNCMF331Sha3.1]|uniref:autotransporter-associated beta strand repeat-containing protein n=1 Tax=Luteibacter sp. UNCMF331Sha3.1 TaxID=1502760 RepID=UPI0008CA5E26|nr:autotransporter-associated beta strand repeat-containing protein [Luteibacter sp. UNCMF331Sha3.1]SEM80135.1 autotransporter-associated beta strand repeat-containing protein [Luteibacter sp. UNCMF331Sha3.1]